MRKTIRFNDVEHAELVLFKKMFHIDNDSEAIKLAITFATKYIKNVSEVFFGDTFDVVLQRKRKYKETDRKVY